MRRIWRHAGGLISYEKGTVMALIARIISVASLTAGLAAGLGYALFGQYDDWKGISLVLGCVGGIIGSVAGAARESVIARHEPPLR